MSTNKPDFDGAITYALGRLAAELPSQYAYHSVAHTQESVLPAAEHLGEASGIADGDLKRLRVAAAFHDIGYIYRIHGHEVSSTRVVAQTLPGFGFDDEAIEAIMGMILATRLPQSPRNLLEELLADADLEALGRDDFFERNAALEQEMEWLGRRMAPDLWYAKQVEFLQSHRYFTPAAQALYGPGKARNLEHLKARLAEARGD